MKNIHHQPLSRRKAVEIELAQYYQELDDEPKPGISHNKYKDPFKNTPNKETLVCRIGEGEACLIKDDETIYFGEKGTVRIPKSLTITSNGYMSCAEIYGTLKTGELFYIHAPSAAIFKHYMDTFARLIDNDFAVDHITIKCKFDTFVSLKENRPDVIERGKSYYDAVCEELNIPEENRNILQFNTDRLSTAVDLEGTHWINWHMECPKILELCRENIRELLSASNWSRHIKIQGRDKFEEGDLVLSLSGKLCRANKYNTGYTIRGYFSHSTPEEGPGPGWDVHVPVLEEYGVKNTSELPDEPHYGLELQPIDN